MSRMWESQTRVFGGLWLLLLLLGVCVCVCVLLFVYSFTELCQVLATVHGLFSLSCGMQDPFLFVVCGIFN